MDFGGSVCSVINWYGQFHPGSILDFEPRAEDEIMKKKRGNDCQISVGILNGRFNKRDICRAGGDHDGRSREECQCHVHDQGMVLVKFWFQVVSWVRHGMPADPGVQRLQNVLTIIQRSFKNCLVS